MVIIIWLKKAESSVVVLLAAAAAAASVIVEETVFDLYVLNYCHNLAIELLSVVVCDTFV